MIALLLIAALTPWEEDAGSLERAIEKARSGFTVESAKFFSAIVEEGGKHRYTCEATGALAEHALALPKELWIRDLLRRHHGPELLRCSARTLHVINFLLFEMPLQGTPDRLELPRETAAPDWARPDRVGVVRDRGVLVSIGRSSEIWNFEMAQVLAENQARDAIAKQVAVASGQSPKGYSVSLTGLEVKERWASTTNGEVFVMMTMPADRR